jgi:large subunit ribosomal protein L25
MQRIELEVSKRDTAAKSVRVRKSGRLPGVFYGAGGDNIAVDCDAKEFSRLGLGSSGAHLIRFASSEGGLNGGVALVREIQTHPVQGTPIHVDFLRVDPNKPVEANVVLSFIGKCVGVVEGGIVQPLRRELEVRALPDKLPSLIEVDVTNLNIHDSIHIDEVALPEGVEAVATENFAIVTVLPPVVEAAEGAEAGEEAVEGAEGASAGEEQEEGSSKEGD